MTSPMDNYLERIRELVLDADTADRRPRRRLMWEIAEVLRNAGYSIPVGPDSWRHATHHAHAYHLREAEILTPLDRLHALLLVVDDWGDHEWPSAVAEILADAGCSVEAAVAA